jgi:hypothetical protein
MVKLGAALLISGISVAAGYGIYELATESLPGPLKGAIIAIALGFLVLLIAVIRDRLRPSREEEQLKEVER